MKIIYLLILCIAAMPLHAEIDWVEELPKEYKKPLKKEVRQIMGEGIKIDTMRTYGSHLRGLGFDYYTVFHSKKIDENCFSYRRLKVTCGGDSFSSYKCGEAQSIYYVFNELTQEAVPVIDGISPEQALNIINDLLVISEEEIFQLGFNPRSFQPEYWTISKQKNGRFNVGRLVVEYDIKSGKYIPWRER